MGCEQSKGHPGVHFAHHADASECQVYHTHAGLALSTVQESELTPTGSNLLDGRFAVFGYVVDNADLLGELQVTNEVFIRNGAAAENGSLSSEKDPAASLAGECSAALPFNAANALDRFEAVHVV